MSDGNPLVLLVDDDSHELALAMRALKAAGLTVEVARDGVEALERLLPAKAPQRPMPMFVLMDLKLPRIGGLDVARRLKADPSTRAIPIVVFSASSEARDLAEGYRAGINSYLVKPVDFDAMRSLMAQVAHYWSAPNIMPARPR
jgi:two-component system response regulator